MKKITSQLLAAIFIIASACKKDEPETPQEKHTDVFFDSFESGDLLTTNPEGFRWTSSAWVTLVTPTTEVWKGGQPDSAPKENAASFPGKDWTAYTGTHSMRFRYATGAEMSEQRFDLGVPMKELWIQFWIRVPVNFSYGPVGDPNKFFALWTDAYSSGEGSTVYLGLHRYEGTGATLAFAYTDGTNGNSPYYQYTPFITTADAGRWMQVVWHLKAESSVGKGDGIIQTYRRWEGETNFEKLHESLEAPLILPTNGPDGFKSGYILGWANAPYTQDTEWILDDFAISAEAPADMKL